MVVVDGQRRQPAARGLRPTNHDAVPLVSEAGVTGIFAANVVESASKQGLHYLNDEKKQCASGKGRTGARDSTAATQ